MASGRSMNLVPCVKWVRRGVAKPTPEKVELSREELESLMKKTQDDLENLELLSDAEDDAPIEARLKGARSSENVDSKRKGDRDDCESGLGTGNPEHLADPILGIGGLVYHASNEDDPYVTLKTNPESDDEDDSIATNDNLLLVGRVHHDSANLEVWVFNEEQSHMYVHHDVILPSFPVAVEWLSYNPAKQESPCNLAAIGNMTPVIDLWDIDILNSLEPVCTLGIQEESKPKKKKKASMLGHKDAVISLAWNSDLSHILASGSADNTVGMWDLATGTMSTRVIHHTDKVQCLRWHPQKSHVLLSGASDRTCNIMDCRTDKVLTSVTIDGEVECLSWNHFSPAYFLAGSDSGHVFYYDSRNTNKPIFTLNAHFKPVKSVCLSSQVPGLLVTASEDETAKIWDIADHKPEQVFSRNLAIGEIFDAQCCPEAPFTFAFAGEKDLTVWNLSDKADVRRKFAKKEKVALPALEGFERPLQVLHATATAHKVAKAAKKAAKPTERKPKDDMDIAEPLDLIEKEESIANESGDSECLSATAITKPASRPQNQRLQNLRSTAAALKKRRRRRK